MFTMKYRFAASVWILAAVSAAAAEEPTARVIQYHNYERALELTGRSPMHGDIRVVIGPQAGGRVLEMTVDGKSALYLDEREKQRQPGANGPLSAGRFDYGPELTV